MMKILSFLLAALLVFLSGCANIAYYAQSISGQLQIWGKERPIDDLLQDSGTPPVLKQKLTAVLRIREFAGNELHLPNNRSYHTYADIERPYVTWNVFATREFSTTLERWCFLVAGCVSYRGYFSEAQARNFAAELEQQGYDVYVGGVTAYSTLGWFSDPVLNTFLQRPESEIARLIFHELAHQRVYVRGDSVFNESFAMTVELEGVRRWLENGGAGQKLVSYQATRQKETAFVSLVLKYRGKLAQLYDSPVTEAEKRLGKKQIFQELQEEYVKLKTDWGGYSGYDRWFAQNLNNARLAALAAYTQLVPAFQTLLAEHHGDLPSFYKAVKEISNLPKAKRSETLAALNHDPNLRYIKEEN